MESYGKLGVRLSFTAQLWHNFGTTGISALSESSLKVPSDWFSYECDHGLQNYGPSTRSVQSGS